jgi:hypothetical protein
VFEPVPVPGAALVGAELVVLVAQFGDHIGQSVSDSIELAAAAAQARLYPDGQIMRVVLMYPDRRRSRCGAVRR